MTANGIQDRQNAAPVQRRTLRIGRKSKQNRPLRRNPPGVQVPYPPLEAICERSQVAFIIEVMATDLSSKDRGRKPLSPIELASHRPRRKPKRRMQKRRIDRCFFTDK
jgi:hypothetical protein